MSSTSPLHLRINPNHGDFWAYCDHLTGGHGLVPVRRLELSEDLASLSARVSRWL